MDRRVSITLPEPLVRVLERMADEADEPVYAPAHVDSARFALLSLGPVARRPAHDTDDPRRRDGPPETAVVGFSAVVPH